MCDQRKDHLGIGNSSSAKMTATAAATPDNLAAAAAPDGEVEK